MTLLSDYRKTGRVAGLVDKIAALGCLDELEGFRAQVVADGRANAAILRALDKRAVQLGRGGSQ